MQRFDGYGNLLGSQTPRKRDLLYVGEAAGFQDALSGFGMRYAMVSGHLTTRALMEGQPKAYDRLWRDQFSNLLKTGVINRVIFEKLGNLGRAGLLNWLGKSPDAREWMGRQYSSGRLKILLYPLFRHRLRG